MYFLVLVGLNWVPQLNVFGKEISMAPLLIVLLVTLFKDGVEDYRRHTADKFINQQKCTKLTRDGVEIEVIWQDIKVFVSF